MKFARGPRHERGAVLIVSLIMLAVMTLFVISMLKTSIVELKIGGSSQIAALNFANAEFGINSFIAANQGRFAPGFLTTAGAGAAINTAPAVYGGTVTLIVGRQLACGTWNAVGNQMGATSIQAVQFDIQQTATGILGGSTTLHQGVQSLAAPGAC